ncbi:MAG: hypothetical protein LHW49_07440 [Candidatus Cloacimonetes bacterium]|nr:hypothetical protein [Candidatus Cloacimonadota bacterium]MDD3501883.1 hypothetical protein [Candidatus Cloacimonadota bacterium]
MKNTKMLYIIISILLVIVLIFSITKINNLKKDNEKIQDYFSQTLEALNEIQDSLSGIDTQDLIIKRMASNLEVDGNISNSEEIMLSIQNINDYIALNKERLINIEETLKEKDIEIIGLQRIIRNLKNNISEKESLIAEMSSQISLLEQMIVEERVAYQKEIDKKDETISTQKSVMDSQETTISIQKGTITAQELEINTIHYVVGKKKQLIEKGFMTKGGLLKKAKKSGDYNKEEMIALNLAEKNIIEIDEKIKSIKVLSDQNVNSYVLEETENGTLLNITDINEFRKIKYLIIQVD